MVAFGVDIARSGEDQTVVAVRQGNAIVALERWHLADTMETTGRVKVLIARWKPESVVVDVIGIGAGVYDRLKEMGVPAVAFNASEKTDARDSSGQLSFLNKRAAAWWVMREMLDPQNRAADAIALPPDEKLMADLTTPRWKVNSGGKIQLESKDDIRKRLGRSTDAGDAVVMVLTAHRISVPVHEMAGCFTSGDDE